MRERRIKLLSAAMMAVLATISVAAQATQNTKTETRVDMKPIPFRVSYEITRTLPIGRMETETEGKAGELVNTYTVSFKDGKPVSKALVSSRRVEPQDEVILVGKPTFETSRHRYYRGRVLTMNASAYDRISAGGTRTATGLPALFGVVAVDPRVIKLGTMLFVEGYGVAIAADTGGAIKGNRIDLCFNKYSEAVRYGRRQVKVHVLN